jgi:DNA-binding CsgD family transcriptional regulator
MTSSVDYISIVEAAYRIDLDAEAWLDGILTSAEPVIESGFGISGYFVDCADGCRGWGYRASEGSIDPNGELFAAGWAQVDPEAMRVHHIEAPAYGRRLPEREKVLLAHVRGVTRQPRLRSVVSINALDSTLRGVCIAAFGGAKRRRQHSVRNLARLGAHIAAGNRLREKLADRDDTLDEAEAIFRGGKLVHASGQARETMCRERLREAAVALDRARGQGSDEAALEAWRALTAGRWSVLETFERDGRRYVVAHPNTSDPSPTRTLAPSELSAARYAALGHSDKSIAYTMGLAPSTVATLLARARSKMGVRTRVELITRVRASTGS